MLFQCQECGTIDNTLHASQGFCIAPHIYDWSYAPERMGKRLCSACGPVAFVDGTPTPYSGQWHNKFGRYQLEKNSCFTDSEGGVIHKETGLPVSQFIKQHPDKVKKL